MKFFPDLSISRVTLYDLLDKHYLRASRIPLDDAELSEDPRSHTDPGSLHG